MDFIKELHNQTNRVIYARITSLTQQERPVETIEGQVTAGSVNIDGASAVRRTCNLTLVSNDVMLSDYYWTLNTKFKLEVGLHNYIDNSKEEIIWFNQGIYIINSFSASLSNNSYTITIGGKDKMCQLNGEIGGLLNSSVDFGKIEEKDVQGNIKLVQIPVKNIIRDMLHQYGDEPFHNIIINDLEDKGLLLREYAYNRPLYMIRQVNNNTYTQCTLDEELEVELKLGGTKKIGELVYDSLTSSLTGSEGIEPDIIIYNNEESVVTKIVYGQATGYTETDLTYPGELIANIGESITSILDKIVNFLGGFEYFYDLDGRFIFQKRRDWVNTEWNPAVNTAEGQTYVDPYATPYSYVFNDSRFFTAIANAPVINNLKNDFTVWGTKGQNVPIHMRYAIDIKPTVYCSIAVSDEELVDYNELYGFNLKGQESKLYVYGPQILDSHYSEQGDYVYLDLAATYDEYSNSLIAEGWSTKDGGISVAAAVSNVVYCDWREIIYQMGQDYRKYNHLDDFELKIIEANPLVYPTGKTGYEQYYVDLEGFWRLIYNPEFQYQRAYVGNFNDGRKYYKKVNDEYVKVFEYIEGTEYYVLSEEFYYPVGPSGEPASAPSDDLAFWCKALYENPEELIFWIDFLDQEGELNKYSVKAIGARQFVKNDNAVKAIHYKDIPLVIFGEPGNKTGYKYFNAEGYDDMFFTSSMGKSAKEAIDTHLYNHSYCIESVTINSIPIYDLKENTRIYINDVNSGIEGDYTLSKITIPLSYNGTMSLTATKAASRLL